MEWIGRSMPLSTPVEGIQTLPVPLFRCPLPFLPSTLARRSFARPVRRLGGRCPHARRAAPRGRRGRVGWSTGHAGRRRPEQRGCCPAGCTRDSGCSRSGQCCRCCLLRGPVGPRGTRRRRGGHAATGRGARGSRRQASQRRPVAGGRPIRDERRPGHSTVDRPAGAEGPGPGRRVGRRRHECRQQLDRRVRGRPEGTGRTAELRSRSSRLRSRSSRSCSANCRTRPKPRCSVSVRSKSNV